VISLTATTGLFNMKNPNKMDPEVLALMVSAEHERMKTLFGKYLMDLGIGVVSTRVGIQTAALLSARITLEFPSLTLNSLDVFPDGHGYAARIWYTDWKSGTDHRLEFNQEECVAHFLHNIRDHEGKLLSERSLH